MRLFFVLSLAGCSDEPPRHDNNICQIFKEYPSWHRATMAVEYHWNVPIAVQMAILHQESHFRAGVMPSHQKLLGIIPWTRPSSAEGYPQALDGTWQRYKKDQNKPFADRDNFATAVDFMGWYLHMAHQKLGINVHDAYTDYLVYHEGMGGYHGKTYLRKSWLIKVAHRVNGLAASYRAQLWQCH